MSVLCEFNVYADLQFSVNELTLTNETAIINLVLIYPSSGHSMMKRFFARMRTNKRGQSFVELMLVALILALLLAGVVEFGFLLNNYLHVLDGGREAARYSANSVAIADNGASIQDFYINTVIQALRVMSPVELVGNNGDDIVISVFSIAGSSVIRFPDSNGWSLCANYADQLFYPPYQTVAALDTANWDSCTVRATEFTLSDVQSLLDAAAPPSGVLIVEIYYNYPQILGLPIFSVFLNPIPVYTYSVMPLSSAEPTPTPRP
jgi:TadE-like protein